ncbi:hypothetical protein SUGI_0372830 [Cryptomeria japonica]|nr:hypothetical protein SUGI_0372830 [Cryptomeria japonica]
MNNGIIEDRECCFQGGKEDFEKKLEYISKEEASVHAKSKRRAQNWRKIARMLIIYSAILEIVALVSAIMSTRSPDLTWQNRALRVLPVFALPVISIIIYSTLGSYFRMRENKDQKTLEKLRAERQAKINELKERTNYYMTQQLIQRYDLDPAAKAAAASALVSKLGAEAGLNVFIQDASLVQNEGKSHDREVVQPAGLRNRKQPHGRNPSVGSITTEQLAEAEKPGTYTMPVNPLDGGRHQGFVVDNHPRARASDGGWIARLAAMLVGEDPSQCYALICANCHMHNGLARKEDFPYITYYCPHCNALNGSQQAEAVNMTAGSGTSNLATDGNESLSGHGKAVSSNAGKGAGNEDISKLANASVSETTKQTETKSENPAC